MRRLLISPFHDPFVNLALEGHFLEELKKEEEILFLYINTPSVVIGRFQNPWKECRPSMLKQTALVRRESGGGTVYHDQGNLNFSFIQNLENYDRVENLETIRSILTPWKLPLYINERHDLTVSHEGGEFKVSGSAFRHKKDRAFHHGTLLIDCRTEKLKASISPGEEKVFLKSSGTASKRSPVINLNTVNRELTIDKVLETFRSHYKTLDDGRIDNPDQEEWNRMVEEVNFKIDELKDDPWIYGKTPAFTQDISVLCPSESEKWVLRVEKGKISEAPPCLTALEGLLYGRGITETLLRDRLGSSSLNFSSESAGNEFFRRLLALIS